MGSIFKKLRGLLAKNWASVSLVLTCDGLRVDFKEEEGLFSKSPGRRGKFRSDPLTLDPAAQI